MGLGSGGYLPCVDGAEGSTGHSEAGRAGVVVLQALDLTAQAQRGHEAPRGCPGTSQGRDLLRRDQPDLCGHLRVLQSRD